MAEAHKEKSDYLEDSGAWFNLAEANRNYDLLIAAKRELLEKMDLAISESMKGEWPMQHLSGTYELLKTFNTAVEDFAFNHRVAGALLAHMDAENSETLETDS